MWNGKEQVSWADRCRYRLGEQGFVMLFFCLWLTALLGFLGLCVDVGNWYLVGQREQRAADAGSLAGAIWLPGQADLGVTEAKSVVGANAYLHADVDAHPVRDQPDHMFVSVGQQTPTIFASLFGLNSVYIQRHAIAAYRTSMMMGSPSNVLGNQPPDTPTWENPATQGKQSNFWLTVSGPKVSKQFGERWTTTSCSQDQAATPVDNCDMSQPPSAQNLDYDPTGTTFSVHVPAGVGGAFGVEAYDAMHVGAGLECTDNGMSGAQAIDPVRYATGKGPYCTGDSASGVLDSTFELMTPDKTAVAGCPAMTFKGFPGTRPNGTSDIGQELSIERSKPAFVDDPTSLYNSFHKWSRLRTFIAPPAGGDYELHVTDPGNSGGENRFSLRAGFLSGSSPNLISNSLVSVAAPGRIQIEMDDEASITSFYFARVTAAQSGTTVTAEFFDLGDSTVDLAMLPPPDATVNGQALTSLTGCTRFRPGALSTPVSAPTCQIPSISADGANGEPGYNGRIGRIVIPVPAGYSCDASTLTGCWIRVRLTYGSHGGTDITSWSAGESGELLHITQ